MCGGGSGTTQFSHSFLPACFANGAITVSHRKIYLAFPGTMTSTSFLPFCADVTLWAVLVLCANSDSRWRLSRTCSGSTRRTGSAAGARTMTSTSVLGLFSLLRSVQPTPTNAAVTVRCRLLCVALRGIAIALCCVARHCDCALTGVRSAVLCPNWGARGSVEVIKHPFFKSLDVGKMRDLAVPSPFAQLVHPEGDVGHLDLPKEPLVWDDPKGGDDYGATFDAF